MEHWILKDLGLVRRPELEGPTDSVPWCWRSPKPRLMQGHTHTDGLSNGSNRKLRGKIKVPVTLGADQPLSAGWHVGSHGKPVPWLLPEQLRPRLWEVELRHVGFQGTAALGTVAV